MFRISAFADEISPDPVEQITVLKGCGVRHIELRSIHKTNVLDLTDAQVQEFKALLEANGFTLSAIGSPIGKIRIDEPFEPHLKRFRRALELCGVFGTPRIRVFSYYPPQEFDGDWSRYRQQVLDRIGETVRLAEAAGVTLVHENEHRIYGDDPDRVVDLLRTINSPHFRGVYDAANYVFCGFDPWQGWQKTKEWTSHFHIKDWRTGESHGSIAGEGEGRIPEVIADAVARGYDGYATMEPHLLGGGPTGGVTGPELFPRAVAAFKKILEAAGATYQ
jgi:sugar phosphate isomerase/epimerase